MNTQHIQINGPLSFNLVVDIIKQLPYKDKIKLVDVIREETKSVKKTRNDKVFTHFASEKILAKEWLEPEEEEAWKNL